MKKILDLLLEKQKELVNIKQTLENEVDQRKLMVSRTLEKIALIQTDIDKYTKAIDLIEKKLWDLY